ncbi:AraC family transcriptional regulator [Acinetobacter sp. MB5]|uniref:AraC family transcriptional regulator n=1 Tax=Acinetobacter sp. MB5 TaxID=2069438 RepID=UPI000DD0B260|nr:helix-turn-helix transcriptional regulator [Acinetobacter sp. MB5]
MPNTKFKSDLIIGLSAQRIYKDITYPHAHFRAQLLYASKGTIQVFTNNQVWIIPPMCALWVPARAEHSMVCLSHVTLTTALIEEQSAQQMGEHCFLIRVNNLLHELLIRLNQLDQLQATEQVSLHDLSTSLQILIFDEIHRANSLPIQIPWPKDQRLIKLCSTLLDAPHDVKDLSTWADEMGASPRTLMRLFQRETGLSYRAWIQQMHIAHALSHISNGESISQISRKLGYSNLSAFSAMFKRHLGQTPQQFKTRA